MAVSLVSTGVRFPDASIQTTAFNGNATYATNAGYATTQTAGTNNTTIATTAFVNTAVTTTYIPIGQGQLWYQYTAASGDRVNNTNYTNTTGRPIMISIMVRGDEGVSYLYIDTFEFSYAGGDLNNQSPLVAIIPAGSFYKITGLGRAGDDWYELRSSKY